MIRQPAAFGRLKSILGSRRPEELVAALNELGVVAEVAPRMREFSPTEWIGHNTNSNALIVLGHPLIKWVNVGTSRERPVFGTPIYEFGVPMPNINQVSPHPFKWAELVSKASTRRPASTARWLGHDPDSTFMARLNTDPLLTGPSLTEKALRIKAYDEAGVWLLELRGKKAPNADVWNCLVRIANHLVGDAVGNDDEWSPGGLADGPQGQKHD